MIITALNFKLALASQVNFFYDFLAYIDCFLFEIGVRTGKCVNIVNGSGVCEIYGWCPPENDTIIIDYNLEERFQMLSNYTVYIKNDIEFARFRVRL